jgi:hypothetical protein
MFAHRALGSEKWPKKAAIAPNSRPPGAQKAAETAIGTPGLRESAFAAAADAKPPCHV